MERERSDRRSRKVSGRLPERFLNVASDPREDSRRGSQEFVIVPWLFVLQLETINAFQCSCIVYELYISRKSLIIILKMKCVVKYLLNFPS